MNEEQLLDGENIDNLDLESMDINDVLNEDSSNEEDESIVNLEDLASEGVLDTDDINLPDELTDIIPEESENLDDILALEDDQDEVTESKEEENISEDLEVEESIEEPIAKDDIEEELLEEVEKTEEIAEEEMVLPDECLEENSSTIEEPQDETQEQIVEEVEETREEILEEAPQGIPLNSDVITDNLNDIKIEFGIEAKGFILSTNMMEAMISKGYIFKEMIDNKVFDAVMIFNGNLDNTVMTDDIKIKIEDGKIQLVKG